MIYNDIMTNHTNTKQLLAIVESDVDGNISLIAQDDGRKLAYLPAFTLVANNMFDESLREDTYTVDGEIVASFFESILQRDGLLCDDRLRRAVLRVCSPGAPYDPADYIVPLYEGCFDAGEGR